MRVETLEFLPASEIFFGLPELRSWCLPEEEIDECRNDLRCRRLYHRSGLIADLEFTLEIPGMTGLNRPAFFDDKPGFAEKSADQARVALERLRSKPDVLYVDLLN